MKNLVNRLLDLIKGKNLFAQEWMNMEKHNKPNGCSVTDEKGRLLHHCITIYSPLSSPSKDVCTFRLGWLLHFCQARQLGNILMSCHFKLNGLG
jgi:hypothetical protein